VLTICQTPILVAEAGELCMLLVYAKAGRDTIPARFLKEVREELEDGFF